MLLTITGAGRVAETEALTSGFFPPVEAILIGDGAPHEDAQNAIALVHQVLSVPVEQVVRISPQAVRFHATIPHGITMTIREFGLQLADGTLYGYLPYETVVGQALYKSTYFSFAFALAVNREPLPEITVNYAPFDTATISASIIDQTRVVIDDYSEQLANIEPRVNALITEKMRTIDSLIYAGL